jgi:hypothetical protein
MCFANVAERFLLMAFHGLQNIPNADRWVHREGTLPKLTIPVFSSRKRTCGYGKRRVK